MSELDARLDEDLQNLSEAYRTLVPADRQRLIHEATAEFLTSHYTELLESIRSRFARLPPPPGKGDSWSW